MNTSYAITTVLIMGFLIGITIGRSSRQKTDLEIYTNSNIYYINGLKVTNEVNDQVLVFENMQQLKNYISDVTASDLK